MSSSELQDWFHLLVRWGHVFAGIMWVGTTYYFTWLDGRFVELEQLAQNLKPGETPESEIWMVHSGGFYRVEKQKVPQVFPEKLHWFRWEAMLTWLTGLLLFAFVYWHGGLMVPMEDARLSNGVAIAISFGLLIAGFAVYDLIWFRLVKREGACLVISLVLIAGLNWFLCNYFAPRAAYLQLGAMLGTIMLTNVWMRILPTQRRMVAALKAGQTPNQFEAARAKASSKHNTFMVVPVVATMISNHFPVITYGHRYNWEILTGLVLVGFLVARWLRRA